MKKIGGNTAAVFQTKVVTKNAIGEGVSVWADTLAVKGWLDLSGGDSKHTTFNAKIQESTHVWLMDYQALPDTVTEETAQMVIDGKTYEVLLIDDPMGMHEHFEVFLKYTGGQNVG
ncbi:MAG: hypothetical protein LIO86_15365 [Lachnospiraceae bacterium]|nr:hypothetical protein [Lachnospiraceae bacterium]